MDMSTKKPEINREENMHPAKSSFLAATVILIAGSAYASDWTIQTKETPKSPWETKYDTKNIEPWPFTMGSACNVTLAGGDHEVKAINTQTGEERTMLCDDVNAAIAQQQREEIRSREESQPHNPQKGKIRLF